jgi:type II secretory ATPase GspE/PulE/Tfp pilus assembly ATPase PilB-like protein
MHLDPMLAEVEVGQYVSAFKAIPVVLMLLLWGRLATWVDKDAKRNRLNRHAFNTGMMAGGLLGFLAFFMLPAFLVALIVMILCVAGATAAYLIARHQKVGLADLQKEVTVAEGELLLFDSAGKAVPPPEEESPDLPAYQMVQTLLAAPMRRGAEVFELTPSDKAFVTAYTVDGVVYGGSPVEKGAAVHVITYLKRLGGLDISDRRKPQVGKLRVSVDGQKHELQINTAGSAIGEQLRLTSDPKRRHERRLEDLGLFDDQLTAIKENIQSMQGIVLASAPKGHGLTSLLYALLRGHDAFLSHIVTVERAPENDLEGITQNRLSANAPPAEEAKGVNWVVSQQPDVVMVSSIEDPRSAQDLIKYTDEGKRAYVGLRAGSTFDTIMAWRKLVADDKAAIKNLSMVISGRLVRRLCENCKVAYVPDPATLRKLNMDPNRVSKLYQARTEPLQDSKGNPMVCPMCHDLRFNGRIGIYEVFMIDPEVKQILLGTSASDAGVLAARLKAAFRKQKMRYLQESALLLVEDGLTSVQEVLRVLKHSETPAPAQRTQAAPRTR